MQKRTHAHTQFAFLMLQEASNRRIHTNAHQIPLTEYNKFDTMKLIHRNNNCYIIEINNHIVDGLEVELFHIFNIYVQNIFLYTFL